MVSLGSLVIAEAELRRVHHQEQPFLGAKKSQAYLRWRIRHL